MAVVKFVENRLRPWTPALAEAVEEEIRRAAAPHPDSVEFDCRIRFEDGVNLSVGILLEREGWGARFVVPFPSGRGEVLSSMERVLRERVLS